MAVFANASYLDAVFNFMSNMKRMHRVAYNLHFWGVMRLFIATELCLIMLTFATIWFIYVAACFKKGYAPMYEGIDDGSLCNRFAYFLGNYVENEVLHTYAYALL